MFTDSHIMNIYQYKWQDFDTEILICHTAVKYVNESATSSSVLHILS